MEKVNIFSHITHGNYKVDLTRILSIANAILNYNMYAQY